MVTRFSRFFVALSVVATCLAADNVQQLADQALKQSTVACSTVQSSADCHARYPAGCGRSSGSEYDAYLDFFKNQLIPPDSQPGDVVTPQMLQTLEAGLPAGLTSNNHRNFSAQFVNLKEGEIVQATGYLYYVQQTGAESCNCERAGPTDSDYHIGLGFDSSRVPVAKTKPRTTSASFHQLQASSMIVEITPHYRAQKEPHWTLAKLKNLYGAEIKVVGQLIADNDHYDASQDCGMQGADTTKCWRMSIWEIHPVTAFYVCGTTSGCSESDSGWIKLENWNPPHTNPEPKS